LDKKLVLNKFLSEKTMNPRELDETCIWLDLPDLKILDLLSFFFFDFLKLIPFLGILKIFF